MGYVFSYFLRSVDYSLMKCRDSSGLEKHPFAYCLRGTTSIFANAFRTGSRGLGPLPDARQLTSGPLQRGRRQTTMRGTVDVIKRVMACFCSNASSVRRPGDDSGCAPSHGAAVGASRPALPVKERRVAVDGVSGTSDGMERGESFDGLSRWPASFRHAQPPSVEVAENDRYRPSPRPMSRPSASTVS